MSSKSLISFIVVTAIVPLISVPVSNTTVSEVSRDNSSVFFGIWDHFKNKYGSGGSFKWDDLNPVLKNFQNCNSSGIGNNHTHRKNDPAEAALFENAPLSVQQLLLNLVDGDYGLNESSLFAASPSILYLIDNKLFCNYPAIVSAHRKLRSSKTGANILVGRLGGKEKPSSGEGQWSMIVTK